MQAAIVIGGGLAGLSAGLHLAEAGAQPLVLEAGPLAGGRVGGAATAEVDFGGQVWPFPAEHGIHGVWGQYHNLRAVLGRIGVRDGLVPAIREDWVHGEAGKVLRAEAGSMVRRSWFPAPFHYIGLLLRPSFLRMLTFRDFAGLPRVVGSLYIALAYNPLCEDTPLEGRTLAGLFDLWPPRLRAFIAALMRSGLAAHPEDVPLSGFLAFLRFYTLLRRDSWEFAYFPDDAERALIQPWLSAIERHGGRVTCNARVELIERDGAGWRVHWREGETQHQASAQRIVLALDAPSTKQLVLASPDLVAAGERLEWPRGLETGIVRFWFNRAPAKGAESGICSGDFTIDNFFWIERFQQHAAAWNTATGGSCVEAHIYGPPEVLALPDATLQARALADIYRAYPELRDCLIHATLQRNQPSHTRFGIGSSPRFLGVVSPWPGISCGGDWVRFAHPALFLERACVTGIAAANQALHALELPPAPIIPASPPELPAALLEGFFRSIRGMIRSNRVRR